MFLKKLKSLLVPGLFLTLGFFPSLAMAGTCTVDATTTDQYIRGFGAASAWNAASNLSPYASVLWANDNVNGHAGLSMLRTRIDPTDSGSGSAWNSEAGPMTLAKSVNPGIQIWSTEWSPPATYKNNNSVDGGGSNGSLTSTATFKGAASGAPNSADTGYASYLTRYIQYIQSSFGVSLYAVSCQNEPDWDPTYEAAIWNAGQFDVFTGAFHSALQTAGLSTKIMITESFGDRLALAATTMNDATNAPFVDIIAGHIYGGGPNALSSGGFSHLTNQEGWETEISDVSGAGPDNSMTSGLVEAGWIHNSIVNASLDAFHHWWIWGSDNSALITSSGVSKKLMVIGQYSKFVRPGYYRMGATTVPSSGVSVSAYKNTNTSAPATVVIVAINGNSSTTSQTFSFNGVNVTSVVPWVTDNNNNLVQMAAVPVSGNSFTYNLTGPSVTSFVGAVSGSTPVPTATNTPVSPTATPTHTNTPVPPTATFTFTSTHTSIPTNTFTFTSTVTDTATLTKTATPTSTDTFTSTNTSVPATSTPTFTSTNTSVPPTATNTNSPVPPTATFTFTTTSVNTPTFTNTSVPPTFTATWTKTNTSVPPTATPSPTATNSFTATSVPPTSTPTLTSTPTHTSVPPTATNTSMPPTATFTHTAVPTATDTPAAPTATNTSSTDTGAMTVYLMSGTTANDTNSPHPQIEIVNTGTGPLDLNNVEVRYWFNCDCTNQTIQTTVDWAGLLPAGTSVTGDVIDTVHPTSLGGQTDYISYKFTGNLVLQPGQNIQIQSRFNKSDWSNMIQNNDWSYAAYSSFTESTHVTGYVNGSLVWGQEPVGVSAALAAASVIAFPNPSTGTGVNFAINLNGGAPLGTSLNVKDANSAVSIDPNAQLTLKVFTLTGRMIWSTSLSGATFGSSGSHDVYWDERNLSGANLANGLYIAMLMVTSQGQTSSSSVKVLILK